MAPKKRSTGGSKASPAKGKKAPEPEPTPAAAPAAAPTAPEDAPPPAPSVSFKKRAPKGQARKRTALVDDGGDDDGAAAASAAAGGADGGDDEGGDAAAAAEAPVMSLAEVREEQKLRKQLRANAGLGSSKVYRFRATRRIRIASRDAPGASPSWTFRRPVCQSWFPEAARRAAARGGGAARDRA